LWKGSLSRPWSKLNRSLRERQPGHFQQAQGEIALGFTATTQKFAMGDRDIDPTTGKAIRGALLGSYSLVKDRDYSSELPK